MGSKCSKFELKPSIPTHFIRQERRIESLYGVNTTISAQLIDCSLPSAKFLPTISLSTYSTFKLTPLLAQCRVYIEF